MVHPSVHLVVLLSIAISLCHGFSATATSPRLCLRQPKTTALTTVSDTHFVMSTPEYLAWYAAGYFMAKAFIHFFLNVREKRDDI
jgi:hypothetical protein